MFVGISQKLVNRVVDQIEGMKRKELESLPKPNFNNVPELRSMVDIKYWGEHLHLKSQMPQKWLESTQQCRVVVSWNAENGIARESAMSLIFDLPFYVPPKTATYSISCGIYMGSTDMPEAMRAEAQKIVDYDVCGVKWLKVREQVVEFLNKCKSLNEALKLWPHLALYIPRDVIEQVEAKREKKTSESEAMEALKSINVEELTAAAVGARLA